MTTQLATFGLCMALGHPLAYVWVLVAEAAAVVAVLAIESGQEVSLEHR
jgi:heme exporter protein D